MIFDGYPTPGFKSGQDYPDIDVIFSKSISADDKIKAMLQKAANCRIIVVVSDDKEIIFFARSYGAKALGVEEFIKPAMPTFSKLKKDLVKPELTYSQIDRINRELKDLWLK